LNKTQFFRLDFSNIRFDFKSKKTGLPYSHFICICGLANIILDPLYVRHVEPRRLAVRNTKRGRPKHFSGKAVEFLYILILFKLKLNMIIYIFFYKLCIMQASGLHKLQNWLGETMFFLIAWIKNFMLR